MRCRRDRWPRIGVVLWLTALLLAAFDVPRLNSPEAARPLPHAIPQ